MVDCIKPSQNSTTGIPEELNGLIDFLAKLLADEFLRETKTKCEGK